MGIPKLTSFINSNYQWGKKGVRGSKIVIDGYSLCYQLHSRNHGWQMGGDYWEFYETVVKYFEGLHELKIDAHVVLDGIKFNEPCMAFTASPVRRDYEQKMKTIASMPSCIKSVTPLFMKTVFVDAVHYLSKLYLDLKFSVSVADGGADQSVAALANELHCPVIALDSDYFIFNIEEGYIPLCYPQSNRLVDLGAEVSCFSYKAFDRQFSLPSPDSRLFFPLFLGKNKYDHPVFPTFNIDQTSHVDDRMLKIIRDTDLVRMKSHLDCPKENVDEMYGLYRCLKQESTIPSHIPEWILELLKQGRFMLNPIDFLKSPTKTWRYAIVIEDMRQPSAWEITSTLRPFVMGALLTDRDRDVPIREIVRQISSPFPDRTPLLVDSDITLTDEHRQIIDVPLASVPQMPLDIRRQKILRVFQCHHVPIDDVPEELQMAVIASRFWLKKIKLSQCENSMDLVHSLVCCILSCFDSLDIPAKEMISIPEREFQISFVHTFAQWQCVLHDLIMFNQVLNHPFHYTSPGKLFSGSVLLRYLLDKCAVQKRMNELAIRIVHVITMESSSEAVDDDLDVQENGVESSSEAVDDDLDVQANGVESSSEAVDDDLDVQANGVESSSEAVVNDFVVQENSVESSSEESESEPDIQMNIPTQNRFALFQDT